MNPENRLSRFVAFILLAGLLLAVAAPTLASSSETKAQPTKQSDDERDDASTPPAPAEDDRGPAGTETAKKGADDPAFNTLEDIVRLRASEATLLADCRPANGQGHETVALVWRDVED